MKVWNGAPTLTTSCNRFIELYLELFPLSLNLQFLPSFLAVPAPTLGTIPCPGYIITGSRVPGYDTSALIRKKLRFFFSSRTVFYIFYSRGHELCSTLCAITIPAFQKSLSTYMDFIKPITKPKVRYIPHRQLVSIIYQFLPHIKLFIP